MERYSRIGRVINLSFLSAALLLSACGVQGSEQDGSTSNEQTTKKESAKPTPPPPPPVPATQPPPEPASPPQTTSNGLDGSGMILGRVVFDEDAPHREALLVSKDVDVCGKTEKLPESLLVGPDSGIKNAVVFLHAVTGGTSLVQPGSNPVIDQTDCIYIPHVLLVPAGATVDIKNSDGILHNIHTYSEKNPAFNTAQPKFKRVLSKTFSQPEMIRVTCDVHDWMTAWIVVQDHPYYALTDDTGAFQLTDVPAGEYELKIWHEELGEQSQSLTVTAGQESSVDITLSRAG